MAISNERIRQILVKDCETKTKLVSVDELKKIKEEHLKDGWKIVKEIPLGNNVKITFQKIK